MSVASLTERTAIWPRVPTIILVSVASVIATVARTWIVTDMADVSELSVVLTTAL